MRGAEIIKRYPPELPGWILELHYCNKFCPWTFLEWIMVCFFLRVREWFDESSEAMSENENCPSPHLNSHPHVHISHLAENYNNISRGHRNSSRGDPRQLLQCKRHDRLHSDYCQPAHSGEYVLLWYIWSIPGSSHCRRNAIASFRAPRSSTRNRAIGMREKGGHGQKRN